MLDYRYAALEFQQWKEQILLDTKIVTIVDVMLWEEQHQ